MDNQAAPLLRLSADIWSDLASYLGHKDAQRLLLCGNNVLIQRLRQGARHLSFIWSSSRYIYLDEVFLMIGTFKQLQSFEFRAMCDEQRHWAPVNWSSLPSSLVSLQLQFANCLVSVMQNGLLNATLPSLEILDLAERATFGPPKSPQRIHFQGLPDSLLVLRLASLKDTSFICKHLQDLPPRLQELSLSFPTVPLLEDGSSPFEKMLFPVLPDSITDLTMQCARICWHFDLEMFPTSLRKFEINAVGGAIYHGSFSSVEVSTLSLVGASPRLTHIHTLLLPSVAMTLQEYEMYIPKSITNVSVYFRRESPFTYGQPVPAVSIDLLPLSQFTHGHERSDIVRTVLAELPRMSQLAILDIQDFSATQDPLVLPQSLHTLSVALDFQLALPTTVTDLTLSWIRTHLDWEEGVLNPDTLANLPCLRKLTLPNYVNLPKTTINSLPNFLEEVNCFPARTWNLLRDRMLKPNQLPNLRAVRFERGSPDFSEAIPSQLREMSISEWDEDYFTTFITGTSIAFLRDSNLETIELTVIGSIGGLAIGFLNHLPKTLKSLSFGSRSVPNGFWPVTLPPKLTRLALPVFGPTERYGEQPSSANPEARFQFPPSLTSLALGLEGSFQPDHLPPYLSSITYPTVNVDMWTSSLKYFASRQHLAPSPTMKLS